LNSVSGDHTLPKGTTCIISPICTHHMPELYPNPWSFNPDNFEAANVSKRHKFSFIAFSGGPRGCIGNETYYFINYNLNITRKRDMG